MRTFDKTNASSIEFHERKTKSQGDINDIINSYSVLRRKRRLQEYVDIYDSRKNSLNLMNKRCSVDDELVKEGITGIMAITAANERRVEQQGNSSHSTNMKSFNGRSRGNSFIRESIQASRDRRSWKPSHRKVSQN